MLHFLTLRLIISNLELMIVLPRLPLRDSGAERVDDCQEPVAGDGRESHYAGNHTQNCITKNGNYTSFL